MYIMYHILEPTNCAKCQRQKRPYGEPTPVQYKGARIARNMVSFMWHTLLTNDCFLLARMYPILSTNDRSISRALGKARIDRNECCLSCLSLSTAESRNSTLLASGRGDILRYN